MTAAKQTRLALRRLSLTRLTFSKLFTDLCESRSVMCLSSPSVNYCCCLRRPLISLGLSSSFVLVRLLYYVLLHYIWDAERRFKRTHYNKQPTNQETNAVEWKARLLLFGLWKLRNKDVHFLVTMGVCRDKSTIQMYVGYEERTNVYKAIGKH